MKHFSQAMAPRACRRFNEGRWSVAIRARRSLDRFLDEMEAEGADILRYRREEEGEPEPDSARIAGEQLGFLLIEHTQDPGAAELLYRAEQARAGRAAVVMYQGPRTAALQATTADGTLTDRAKREIFDAIARGTLPGGCVRVCNRRVNATRLTIAFARDIAGWLGAVMNHPDNRGAARDGREHDRLEAELTAEGKWQTLHGNCFGRRVNASLFETDKGSEGMTTTL